MRPEARPWCPLLLAVLSGIACSSPSRVGLQGPGEGDCDYSPEQRPFAQYRAPVVDGCMRYQAEGALGAKVAYCNTCEEPRAFSALAISDVTLGDRVASAVASGLILIDAEGGSLSRCEQACHWRNTQRPPTSVVFLPPRSYFDLVLPFSMSDSTDAARPRTVLAILALPRFSVVEEPDATPPLVDLRALCEAVDEIPPLAPDSGPELPAALASLEESFVFQVLGRAEVPGRRQPRVSFAELCAF